MTIQDARHDVAGLQPRSKGRAELFGRRFIGQGHGKSRHLAMPAF